MRLSVLIAALVVATSVPTTVPTVVLTAPESRTDPPAVRMVTCARAQGPLVAYGHSYLSSPRIGGARASYATVAASALGVRAVTRAVDRATIPDVDRLVRSGPTRWAPGSSDLVVLDAAINDIGNRLPTARWTAALRRTLSALTARPRPTILLVRPLPVARAGHPGRDPKVVAGYAAAQRRVAAEFSTVRIVDASAGWNPRLHLSVDGVHPNTAGMLHLARAVQGGALRALCRP